MMEFGFPADAYVIVNKIVVVNRRAAELPPLPLWTRAAPDALDF